MAYDYRCPKCGAYLDPGEQCDCEDNENSSDAGSRQIVSYAEFYNHSQQLRFDTNYSTERR